MLAFKDLKDTFTLHYKEWMPFVDGEPCEIFMRKRAAEYVIKRMNNRPLPSFAFRIIVDLKLITGTRINKKGSKLLHEVYVSPLEIQSQDINGSENN